MKYFVKALQARRCRGGQVFTDKGRVIDLDELADRNRQAIEDDPYISLRAANEADEAMEDGDEPVVLSDAEQITRITDAIKALAATDYERSGKPKVAAIRTELAKLAQPGEAEIEVRADRRDEVFAAMVEAGFTIPVAT